MTTHEEFPTTGMVLAQILVVADLARTQQFSTEVLGASTTASTSAPRACSPSWSWRLAVTKLRGHDHAQTR
jgi:hypothetical protein